MSRRSSRTCLVLAIGALPALAAEAPEGEPPAAKAAPARPAAPEPAPPKPDAPPAVAWVRAGPSGESPTWGTRGGLLWGLPSGLRPRDGPRGLIRLRYPTLPGDREDPGSFREDLINFIAIEPIVRGRRGFSELERSRLDDAPGLRLVAEDPGQAAARAPEDAPPFPPGRIERLPSGVEVLSVAVRVERFENGAHVRLLVSQRSDAPDEIEISVRSEPGSALMEYCILTATMGNKARARRLWLADGYASSLDLYPGYQGDGFAPHAIFPLDRLRRTERGDVLAAITTDEADPASVDPFPGRPGWRYAGVPVTQYWKKRAGSARDDLHVAINARATYWLSRQPIPGGVAIENFEMRERFTEGQSFVFGITRKTPRELGSPTGE